MVRRREGAVLETGSEAAALVSRARRGAWCRVLAAGVAVLLAACGPDAGSAGGDDAAPDEAIVVPGPEGAGGDGAAGEGLADDTLADDTLADGDTLAEGDASAGADTLAGPDRPPPDDEPALPALPGEGAPRDFRLLLVNLSEREVRVFASAGAARVALDTVPAGDSTRVDIRVRADRVELEAEDDRGRGLGSLELELVPGALNRWEIGPPPGPRVARAASPVTRSVPATRRSDAGTARRRL